jgi:hypothetical protein
MTRHFTMQIWRTVKHVDYVEFEVEAKDETEAKAKAQTMLDEGEIGSADWAPSEFDDDVTIDEICAAEFQIEKGTDDGD